MLIQKKFLYAIISGLLLVPMSAFAVSSSSFQLDENVLGGTSQKVNSANFYIEGSVSPFAGVGSSAGFTIEGARTPVGYCGDDILDSNEDCEGANLNGQSCATLGYAGGGTLGCTASCAFSFSGCTISSGGGGGGGGTPYVPSTPVSLTDQVSTPPQPSFSRVITDKGYTYLASKKMFGFKSTNATEVLVNGITTGVSYPSEIKWEKMLPLVKGTNVISIQAKNEAGTSDLHSITLVRRAIGDINKDTVVDDFDLSLFAARWEQNWGEGDFNEDLLIDDYDLSLLVAYWTM